MIVLNCSQATVH